jgi:drug/metabolite transporter (DMT)-like permease
MMMFLIPALMPLTGEIAALTSACLWASGSVVFGTVGRSFSALELNLIKGLVAVFLLLLTLMVQGSGWPESAGGPLLLLALSGMLGIGLSDTFLFLGLKILGARRILLLKTLSPPLTAVLAALILQEILAPTTWLGIALVIGGVAWVISERSTLSVGMTASQPLGMGIRYGLLATVGEACGAVLSRAALAETEVTPLWAALIRLLSSLPVLLIWMGWAKQPLQIWAKLRHEREWQQGWQTLGILALTAVGTTYLGIWLQQTAIKYTAAGIAQTLGSTSPLFVLPMVAWMGERVSWRAFLGVALALVGVGLCLIQPMI